MNFIQLFKTIISVIIEFYTRVLKFMQDGSKVLIQTISGERDRVVGLRKEW